MSEILSAPYVLEYTYTRSTGPVVGRFLDEGWIDAPTRPGKRPGAFCAYTVPSHHPYLFLNWTGRIGDVLTLAHELGHSLVAQREGIKVRAITLWLLGGVAEIIPMVVSVPESIRNTKNVPYTPLELAGRDIYLAEGCYNCHSQMIRPIRAETERYGEYSKPGEFVWDHPFQWGSRRIGPDLHRVGNKYPDLWHVRHMDDPRAITPGSIMPAYPWLLEQEMDFDKIRSRVDAMIALGGRIPFRVASLGIDRELSIRQLSLEEDSCREVSDIGHRITFRTDRLGMPLIETVTAPELRTPEEVEEAILLVGRVCRSTGHVRVGMGDKRPPARFVDNQPFRVLGGGQVIP